MLQTNKDQPAASQETKFNLDDYLKGLENVVTKPFGGLEIFKNTFSTMEDTAVKLATSFGGTASFSQAIKDSMAGAASSMAEIGGSMSDIEDIQRNVTKSLQTQTILNEESYKDLFASAQLVSDGTKGGAQMTSEMIKMFTNAGYGLYNIGKEMTGILNTAREVGVTATAVYEQLNSNMSKLALYNFENGVQGMAKMAAEAAGLRIDMKTTLGVADKLFNPEKAIEMAAGFQRLGVQVTSLLDPYKLMDMARNDPKKLQESILEASKQLTYFDKESKSFRILPGAQGQLREIADVMGITSDELAKMALNSSDLEKKLKEIKFPSDFASDADRKMIANMAQMSGDSYVVTFKDEKDKTVTKRVTELSEKDRASLVEANKPALSAIDLQREANGYLRGMYNALVARQIALPARAAASTQLSNVIKSTKEKVVEPYAEGLGSIIGVNREKRDDKTGFLSSKDAQNNLSDISETIKKALEFGLQGNKTGLDAQLSKLTDAGTDATTKGLTLLTNTLSNFRKISTQSVTPNQTQQSSVSPNQQPVVSSVSPVIGSGVTPASQRAVITSTQTQNAVVNNSTPITINYNDHSHNTVMDNSKILDLKKAEIQNAIYEAVKKVEQEQKDRKH
jgi:hypothetical protein